MIPHFNTSLLYYPYYPSHHTSIPPIRIIPQLIVDFSLQTNNNRLSNFTTCFHFTTPKVEKTMCTMTLQGGHEFGITSFFSEAVGVFEKKKKNLPNSLIFDAVILASLKKLILK
uniref:Uncharacterized protein n=1 Tax=Cacopsylla melanoneura TaxID=428564 RepID=A0A8D8RSR6_9HEMI